MGGGGSYSPPGEGDLVVPQVPPWEGVCGKGFRRFIEARWPRSKITPLFPGESDENYKARDRNAASEYEEWLYNSYHRLMSSPRVFVLPYGSRTIDNPIRNLSNFPPDSCRLKFPLNVSSLYDSFTFVGRFTIINGTLFDNDWVYRWNDMERLYPYPAYQDLSNFYEQPQGDEMEEDDTADFQQEWRNWFTSTWPMSQGEIPYLNQDSDDYPQYLANVQKQYNDWVDLNWEKCISRVPEERLYWDWPMPYDRNNLGISINVPPIECQLLYGFYRTEAIIGKQPGAAQILGIQFYKKIWTGIWPYRQRGFFKEIAACSENLGQRIGDNACTNIRDHPFDNLGNYFWGPGGKLERRYPKNFPPRFELDVEAGDLNFGLGKDWPDPYDVVSSYELSDSKKMPHPSTSILFYWDHLIETFKRQNPRLYIPLYSPTAPEQAKRNYDTDRIGFKMWPKGTYFASKTWEMRGFHKAYEEMVDDFDEWLFSFSEKQLHLLGVFRKDQYYPQVEEYREWRSAVLQAVHLRYAERHHFFPWEIFATEDSDPSFHWPNDAQVDQIALAEEFEWKWPEWVWADNFLSLEEKKALRDQRSPYNYVPFQTDIISWESLMVLLKTIQHVKSTQALGNDRLDIRKLDERLVYDFGQFVWNSRRETDLPDTEFLNVTHGLSNFLKGIGLNTKSAAKTWNLAFQYLGEKIYKSLIQSNPPVVLKKSGKCIIDPSKEITFECEIWVDAPPKNPYDHQIKNIKTLCKEFWREQWYATEGLTAWPVYTIVNGQVVDSQAQPIPGFWKKLWNTFFGYDPTSYGILIPDTGDQVAVIQGFILPTPPPGGYPQEILDLYAYMRTFGMPIIRKEPPLLIHSPRKWSDLKEQQWASYIAWIEINVATQDEPFYSSPKSFLRNSKGEYILGEDGNRIINSFPSFGVFPIDSQTDFKWVANPSKWVDSIFGEEDTFALFLNLAKKFSKLVIEVLQELIRIVDAVLPLWKIGLIIAAGIGGLIILDNSTKNRPPQITLEEVRNAGRSVKRRKLENQIWER